MLVIKNYMNLLKLVYQNLYKANILRKRSRRKHQEQPAKTDAIKKLLYIFTMTRNNNYLRNDL
jgi:hypothetical protein